MAERASSSASGATGSAGPGAILTDPGSPATRTSTTTFPAVSVTGLVRDEARTTSRVDPRRRRGHGRRRRRGLRTLVASSAARRGAPPRPRVVGGVPDEPRASSARGSRQDRLRGMPRLRARRASRTPGPTGARTATPRKARSRTAGARGARGPAVSTCHAFAPDRPAPTCIGCHVQRHETAGAIVQHATTDCLACHRVHEAPSIVPADCTTCHEEKAIKHGEHEGTKGCRDCHQAHAPAAAAVGKCSSCHAQPAGAHPAGHDSCVGCHQPHTFVAGGASACTRCHGEKATLAAEAAPAHAVCTSCHTPHDPGNAAASCAGCHANVHVDHGRDGGSQAACVTCHSPHDSASSTRGDGLHRLPHEGGPVRHGSARRRSCVRGVPQAPRVRDARRHVVVFHVPRARDSPRVDQCRPSGVRVVPRSLDCARPGLGSCVRYLPLQRAGNGSSGSPEVQGVSRPACRGTHAGVRQLSPGQGQGTARVGRRRMRDVPSAPRAGRRRVPTVMYDMPRSPWSPRPARSRRPCRLLDLSRGVARAAPGGPRDLHRELPSRQA